MNNYGAHHASPRPLNTSASGQFASRITPREQSVEMAKAENRDPLHIIIHPETTFGLNVRDNRSFRLVDMFVGNSFHDKIRLPKPHVMVDAIIDTFLELGDGVLSQDGRGQLLVWLASIVDHGFRVMSTVPGEGQDAYALLGSIKQENRAYFEAWFDWDTLRKADVETYRDNRMTIINDKPT
ncbi:hypothetical protein D9619_002964 [Psilocybe cf. subviscida]|uniref:Uncharacterized protein n=1 Tax=Psilocybe cf. subviscida TaxID=2480587 RepID=A0A8H5EU52_9AGAR|nr:hypothetical protein D9619_002964 [Psilocybe cf. subviscida]